MSSIELYDHQREALDKLDSGSVLCGGVGSGKSRTALAYFYTREIGGFLTTDAEEKWTEPEKDTPLYIITTARKRDLGEWEEEMKPFYGLTAIVDSWNNIAKYKSIKDCFFIFDEQRAIGYGKWARTFITIARANRWIMLSATPGDVWLDYVPVFVANGFYPNKTSFLRRHAVFNRFTKYPKIDRYVGVDVLEKFRAKVLVEMPVEKPTVSHHEDLITKFDIDKMQKALKDRVNPYTDEPIRDAGELCRVSRLIVNSDESRLEEAKWVFKNHPRVIAFYNFDYELEALRTLLKSIPLLFGEYNGHKHQPIPDSEKWVYLVQYTAGAEGWNCIKTDTVLFFSENYSYRIMAQAAGRIDRLNTPYKHLYYYHLISKAPIDRSIRLAITSKRVFNEKAFSKEMERKEWKK